MTSWILALSLVSGLALAKPPTDPLAGRTLDPALLGTHRFSIHLAPSGVHVGSHTLVLEPGRKKHTYALTSTTELSFGPAKATTTTLMGLDRHLGVLWRSTTDQGPEQERSHQSVVRKGKRYVVEASGPTGDRKGTVAASHVDRYGSELHVLLAAWLGQTPGITELHQIAWPEDADEPSWWPVRLHVVDNPTSLTLRGEALVTRRVLVETGSETMEVHLGDEVLAFWTLSTPLRVVRCISEACDEPLVTHSPDEQAAIDVAMVFLRLGGGLATPDELDSAIDWSALRAEVEDSGGDPRADVAAFRDAFLAEMPTEPDPEVEAYLPVVQALLQVELHGDTAIVRMPTGEGFLELEVRKHEGSWKLSRTQL